jgi:predicted nucleic acid-binding protein
MILVDSNIPMYLVGAAHPRKVDAQRMLEQLIAGDERLVTDVEVLQEILHRYSAIDRREAIQPAFDAIMGVVDEVLPIEAADVERAKTVLAGSRQLSARDALHIAIMERHGIHRILSFDSRFDSWPGLSRIGAVS